MTEQSGGNGNGNNERPAYNQTASYGQGAVKVVKEQNAQTLAEYYAVEKTYFQDGEYKSIKLNLGTSKGLEEFGYSVNQALREDRAEQQAEGAARQETRPGYDIEH